MTKVKTIAVAAGCAAAGAIAGIAGAAASPSSHTATAPPMRPFPRFGYPGLARPGLGPAVHVQAVVLNRAGTGYITVTEDSGTVQSVSGDQLTIKEAVGNVTYRTVTLTIPANATVTRDFATSTLSALRSGDRVTVSQSSEGTYVTAGNFGPAGRGFALRGAVPGGPWFGPRGKAVPAPPGPAGPGAPPAPSYPAAPAA